MNSNVVIVGHVDHGKSTLIGRLLYDSQNIQDRKIEEVKEIAAQYKKRFEFAHLLDSLEEEVREDKTIDTTQVIFKGKNYYTIIDAPGHKEFLKNMLTGASYAHAAVLVVSAKEGVEEQTRRHLFLLHFLRIDKIFICVNKLDLLNYEKEPFQKVKKELTQILVPLGYDPKNVPFIPISALEGDNIYKRTDKIPWYKGPTLIEALDKNIKLEKRDASLLRFVVQDIYKIDKEKIVVGRVEAGTLREKDDVIFSPSNIKTRVKKIKVFSKEIKEANEGDSIGLILKGNGRIKRGEVCSLTGSAPLAREEFSAEMVLLSGQLQESEPLFVKCGTNKVKCWIKKIVKKIDSETAKEINQDLQKLNPNEAAWVKFKLSEPVVVENYSRVPSLGRFILEKAGKNIGAGIVLEK